MSAHTYTDKDLYGASGRPAPSDIQQNELGDCYFLGALGATAGQQPERLQNAIRYDATTGNFEVTLYREVHKGGFMGLGGTTTVSQAEIQENLDRKGGSRADNVADGRAPIWPAVVETAYAKSRDSDPANGLTEGFDAISKGGKSHQGMLALTGQRGEWIRNAEVAGQGLNKTFDQISLDLKEHRPITLSTDPESSSSLFGWIGRDAPKDGLANNHVYIVEGIRKDATTGEVMVTLRNPWASNDVPGEPALGAQPTVEVSLNTLVKDGGFEAFNVGPKPVASPTAQREGGEQNKDTSASELDALFARLSDPAQFDAALRDAAHSQEGQALRQHAAHSADAAEREAAELAKTSATVGVEPEARSRSI